MSPVHDVGRTTMGRLLYSTICSLDGYVADRDGGFGWAYPGEEVVAAVVELDSALGTQLFGRRTYELMTGWETDPAYADRSPQSAAFAQSWTQLDKVVYSTTLEQVTTTRTRLERRFDPAQVRSLLDRADHDVGLGGPTLAASALAAGLVDEVVLFVAPAAVGGGLPALATDVRLDLRLLDQRRFDNGFLRLRYAVGVTDPR